MLDDDDVAGDVGESDGDMDIAYTLVVHRDIH